MVNYKEIIQLTHKGYSQRQIATNVENPHNTIREVLNVVKATNIAWSLEESVTNEQQRNSFSGKTRCRESVSGTELWIHPCRVGEAKENIYVTLERICS